MANSIKKKMKRIGRYAWELAKPAILPLIMYSCAGLILMMLTMRGETITWNGGKVAWTVVCVLGGAGYHALVAWAKGGSSYEMLVTGNVQRTSLDAYGNEYKMSNHKEAQEYRVWKGFVAGGCVAIFPIAFGIILGCNQTTIHSGEYGNGLGIVVLLSFLFSGWSVIPFYCMNSAGISVSYFLSILFALIPVAVGGGCYIGGAYGKRNKRLRILALEEKAAAEEEARRANKKINYGGLPGTKPKKRK